VTIGTAGNSWKSHAEASIQALRGVTAVSISLENNEPKEIHVVTDGSRSPKQIVRDIESVFRAEFGMKVDHRRISVAERGKGLPAREPRPENRLNFLSVNLLTSGLKCHAQVELSLNGVEALGTAVGSSSTYETYRLISLATLNAMEKFIDEDCIFSLGDLQVFKFAGDDLFVVEVKKLEGRGELSLTGCCRITRDPDRAVVFATLDAVNRVFAGLKKKEHIEYEVGPSQS